MKSLVKTTILIFTVLVTGCSVGPDYRPPDTQVQENYAATTQPSVVVDLRHWWFSFNDPTLDSLIERASSANLDLKLAAARIREARAARGIASAGFYPTVDANGSYSRIRDSQTAFNNEPDQNSGSFNFGGQ